MAYTPTQWKDHIVETPNKYQQTTNADGTVTLTKREGNVVQQGTAVSATNLNKMEQGIVEAHAQLDQTARVKQTLTHGVNVLNAAQNAPANIEIEGRTLVPMQNTVLDATKYYVLADPKTKVKFADNTVLSGIAKFTGKAERPTIIRVANFGEKVAGSTLENPHKAYRVWEGINNEASPTTLVLPNNTANVVELYTELYARINSINNVSQATSVTKTNGIAQHLFSFDLIAEIERNVGRIPRATVAEKVAWLKTNLENVILSWHGFGLSATGNKVNLAVWKATDNTWGSVLSHTAGTPSLLASSLNTQNGWIPLTIDSAGFVHYLSYAEPSDGTIASTINTDYVQLQIELKPSAILHDPRVPLYEVPKAHYDLINLTWSAEDTMKRYPSVAGPTHLQNPYIIAEGENLLPPFSEWTLHANAKMLSAYELEFAATSSNQETTVTINVTGGQIYYSSVARSTYDGNARVAVYYYDSAGAQIGSSVNLLTSAKEATFTVPTNAVTMKFRLVVMVAGNFMFSQPMLTLGNQPKPFVPRNPSYLFVEATLGEVAGVKDVLYEQDGKYLLRKFIEHVVLDGSHNWTKHTTTQGLTVMRLSRFNGNFGSDGAFAKVTKYNGVVLVGGNKVVIEPGVFDYYRNLATDEYFYLNVSHTESGFSDSFIPTNNMIKAYFNGWKYTGNGTTHSWVSIVDGTTAPTTQTEAFVAANKAPNYTPYKISYALQTPQIVPVKTEGAISVNGLTQVEVGSGVIVREVVKPEYNTSNKTYLINNSYLTSQNTFTKNRVGKFLNIYKNGKIDNDWKIKSGIGATVNGTTYAEMPEALYLNDVEYTATYWVLDKQAFTTNALNVTAQYANNIRGALEDTTKKVEDVKTETSINTNLLYDVLKRLKAGGL